MVPGPRTLFPLAPLSLVGTNVSGPGPISKLGAYIIISVWNNLSLFGASLKPHKLFSPFRDPCKPGKAGNLLYPRKLPSPSPLLQRLCLSGPLWLSPSECWSCMPAEAEGGCPRHGRDGQDGCGGPQEGDQRWPLGNHKPWWHCLHLHGN